MCVTLRAVARGQAVTANRCERRRGSAPDGGGAGCGAGAGAGQRAAVGQSAEELRAHRLPLALQALPAFRV